VPPKTRQQKQKNLECYDKINNLTIMANYKKHSARQKAKIALEALKENKTLSELSSQYGVASSQISTWKQQLLQGAEELFTHSSRL
jgi:transposase-like protein